MKIHYQTYEAIDKVEVLQMMEDFSALDNYTFNSDQREKSLLDFTAHDAFGKLYVIKKELETIGYIVLTFGYSFGYNGRDAFIDEFYIKEAFRNKGIGKKTMDFIAEKAKTFDVKAIHLEVEHHNENAKHLYASKAYKNKKRSLLTKIIQIDD